MAVELTERVVVDQIYIYQHAIKLRAVVNLIMNLRVPQATRDFLSTRVTL